MKRLIKFITEGIIWRKSESEYRNRYVRWAVRQLKVLLVTSKGIGKHNIVVLSASLTFYTLMSLVPIVALIFAVVKGFGLQKNFYENLYSSFPQYNDLIDNILTFANNLLNHTKGGIIAGVGLVVLFYALMRVFGNVEKVFNQIWEVRNKRGLTRKFSDYLTVVIIAPLLWILFNSLSAALHRNVTWLAHPFVVGLLFSGVALVVAWAIFTFLYVTLPNTKVRLGTALTAAIIAGSAFYLFQSIYVWVQSSVMSYNAIYGSFAALPLFLIWLQVSWQIVLFGAELSYAYQNFTRYEQEQQALEMSYRDRQKVMLAALITIDTHFDCATGAVGAEDIAAELKLPVRIVREMIFKLENSSLVATARDMHDDMVERYLPLKNIDMLKIKDVINTVENQGGESVIEKGNPLMAKISDALEKLWNSHSEWDRPLKELLS